MADALTPEERAAIAAFPEDQVYRCRRGETGIPLHGYSMRDAMRQAANRSKRNVTFLRNRLIDEEIRALANRGLTDKEISEKVKLKQNTVYQRRYRMGLVKGKSI